MSEFRADLHCHTTCSDGTLSPEELILQAKACGLSGLCITDHDTVNAYPAAILAAQQHHIWLGSGVEFSTMERGKSVHILGYDINLESEALKAFCKRHLERRKNRNHLIVDKLKKQGLIIEWEEQDHVPLGRPHIAQALMAKGYVGSVQEAFQKWIGDNKPCFAAGTPMTVDETLAVIHGAGGKAFLAHPHLLDLSPHSLLKKPFDGIECYYASFPKDREQKWIDLAQKNRLLISGGSDFHGAIKPHNPLGCSWVDEESFHRIFETHKWH